MDTKNALLAILGGVALTTLFGILLTPYRDSSRQKKTDKKTGNQTETPEKTKKNSIVNGKNRFEKMGEDMERMVNEGGNEV